jgi:hypothetical protein
VALKAFSSWISDLTQKRRQKIKIKIGKMLRIKKGMTYRPLQPLALSQSPSGATDVRR